uniref:Uncharacterized protein n=1 Tax=Arundo donax TaxID=35708 RepID=A0A0A9GXX1_ARUDO
MYLSQKMILTSLILFCCSSCNNLTSYTCEMVLRQFRIELFTCNI